MDVGRRPVSPMGDEVLEIVRQRGLRRLAEPVVLASGQLSRDFVDAKAALARGRDLETACRALLELAADLDFDAVGGLTMGADQFAHVMAVLAGTEWFVVRKEPKHRGTNRLIEGADVGPRRRVLLVDDVVTTGGSLQKALTVVAGSGATVVGAVVLVDRADASAGLFAGLGVPYRALLTYRDLGIEPVGSSSAVGSPPSG